MKLAFLTMVWRDYWLLEKWVAHNARYVPKKQLYVINHGGDPEIDRIAEGCNVISIPREEVTPDLTRRRWDLKGGIAAGLMGFYDMVVTTDVDEFLVYVGEGPGLVDHLAAAERDTAALSPVGLNMIPTEGDGTGGKVLENHPNAMVAAKYTKPCIANRPVGYTIGGHGLFRGNFRIDPELVLLHLHYVTPDYQERMAAREEIVQQSKDYNAAQETPDAMPKRYWINWSQPGMIRDKDFGNFARAEEMDVSGGFGEVAAVLREAVVVQGKKSVVEPKIVNARPRRIVLPQRFRSLI
ncbi:hypothetical protein ACRARG_20585 [Pseudooceanicola sp. C21-150M6]|uniref:hypothetical protein n=1 Tax=Pseudooceanicola sp. C21-150M6 TaxID=3434355 RepID=UPI003D7F1EB3